MEKPYEFITIMAGAIFTVLLLIVGYFWTFRRGDMDHWLTNVNGDTSTKNEIVYHTGSVRVYKFRTGLVECYLADKAGESTSIFCFKALQTPTPYPKMEIK